MRPHCLCFPLISTHKVCRSLNHLIRGSLELRYRLELSVSGSEDGGSNLSLAERYRLLLDRQDAWSRLDWTVEDVTMASAGRPGQWDLTDGMLVQNRDEHRLVVNQVPSRFRGIESKNWEYQTEFRMRDFASDSRQDVLAVIEQPDEQCVLAPNPHFCSQYVSRNHPEMNTACTCCSYQRDELIQNPRPRMRHVCPTTQFRAIVIYFPSKFVTTTSGFFFYQRS